MQTRKVPLDFHSTSTPLPLYPLDFEKYPLDFHFTHSTSTRLSQTKNFVKSFTELLSCRFAAEFPIYCQVMSFGVDKLSIKNCRVTELSSC